jgi:hypothetical protein
MGLFFSYLFSPLTILAALIGAIFAVRMFYDTITLNRAGISAFLAAWLARPLILLLASLTLDETSFEGLAFIVNFLGGTLFGGAFAAIGALGYQYYEQNF